MPSYTIIADDQALSELCIDLQLQEVIALDTEFIRTRTYYPKLALLQLGTAQHTWLVDPLAISDAAPLIALLENPDVCKVIHSCSEDLETLQHAYGCLPKNLIDTQIAAAFAGEGWGMGYQRMVENLLGVQLSKDVTRSDWLQRPLDDKQLDYAAADVAHLIPCFLQIQQRLLQQQRWQWCVDYCVQMLADSVNPNANSSYYLRVKSAWQLDRQQLKVLQVLTQWREQMAQEKDVPRGYVIEDNCLLTMAKSLPETVAQLGDIPKLHPKAIRRYGEALLAMIQQTRNTPKAECPARLPRPLPLKAGKKSKALRALVNHIAQRENIAVELLLRKADVAYIMRQHFNSGDPSAEDVLPNDWPEWRIDLLGEAVMRWLEDNA